MNNVIYVKKLENYDDILIRKHSNFPLIFKKFIFLFKNLFNVITKKKIEDANIWVLPIQEKYSLNKMNNIFKRLSIYNENIYVFSENMYNKEILNLINKYNLNYLEGKKLKKFLIFKVLEYIKTIQNQELESFDITILANDASELNIYLIEKLARTVKSIKVVSSNIYKFKNLEEKLYNEYGIAIQFSNSYKKSLAKSKIIMNLDFNEIDINEYELFNKSIIINCTENDIKIKSKLFNGIVINSCNIKLPKIIKDKFKRINIYDDYNWLALYESITNNETNFDRMLKKIDDDKIYILNLIGNNGIINKNEFKNISKKLDKKIKRE